MNLLDAVIVVLLGASAIHGIYLGAAAQVLSFGGFWGGLLVGSLLAPEIARLAGSPSARALISILVVFGSASLLGGAGRHFGAKIWPHIRGGRLRIPDSAAGAAIAAAATLLAVWLTAVMLSSVPVPRLSTAIASSRLVTALVDVMPPAPRVFSKMRHLFSAAGFPQVFAELEPSPGPEVALPGDPEVASAVRAAGASTVRVRGLGCGGIKTGSGFVAGEGLVVTNAHVVAGIDSPQVEDGAGPHRAVPVFFDSQLDLAALRVTGLAGRPLALETVPAPRGGGAAVLGFPGGGPFRGRAAAVRDRFEATGRDIYGTRLVRREVYQMQGTVREGNSGGPFVDQDGHVLGVVFSRSAFSGSIGYSLTAGEVAGEVAEAASTSRPVGTGPCT